MPHRRLRSPDRIVFAEGKMNLRVLSNGHAYIVASFRDLWPYAILGLGGLLTIAWIVLLSWIPLRLITSAISMMIVE
jgi:hypothetical protein